MDKIKEKHRLGRKAIQTKDPEIRIEYNKIRNQVRKLTRSIVNDYEKEIAKNAKENPKAIWRYINLKSKIKQPMCWQRVFRMALDWLPRVVLCSL